MKSIWLRDWNVGDKPTIFGIRSGLIGDTVMALPMLNYLDQKYGEYELIFSIAKKCKQSKGLYENDKRIKHIKITDEHDSFGKEDVRIITECCDLYIDCFPEHPFVMHQDWYNYRSCVDETLFMAGIHPDEVQDKTPKLYQSWEDKEEYNLKNICVWPFAGYGATQMAGVERSPSKEWWRKLTKDLNKKGYNVFHFGMDNEPDIGEDNGYKRFTNLSFFEQVQLSLSCGFAIGTDSGSMWVLGAYNKMPQINLLTNWQHNHRQNFMALAPISNKAINLFAEDGCDNISKEQILNEIDKL